jgi:hypothetical protein
MTQTVFLLRWTSTPTTKGLGICFASSIVRGEDVGPERSLVPDEINSLATIRACFLLGMRSGAAAPRRAGNRETPYVLEVPIGTRGARYSRSHPPGCNKGRKHFPPRTSLQDARDLCSVNQTVGWWVGTVYPVYTRGAAGDGT